MHGEICGSNFRLTSRINEIANGSMEKVRGRKNALSSTYNKLIQGTHHFAHSPCFLFITDRRQVLTFRESSIIKQYPESGRWLPKHPYTLIFRGQKSQGSESVVIPL